MYKTKSFPNNKFRIVKILYWREICLVMLYLTSFLISFGQEVTRKSFINTFRSVNAIPRNIDFYNNIDLNIKGGHIQGVQSLMFNNQRYFVLSGSSNSSAYLVTVKLNDKNEVISMTNLMENPFKHAGGFQVYQHYLAIGIEDDDKKDKSKVCIYNISNPEQIPIQPITEILRKGKPKRATAGCVGITGYADKIVLAVGDWDTQHIDFYECNLGDFPSSAFAFVGSLSSKNTIGKNSMNNSWLPYQNINLFATNNHELYLIGFGKNENDDDVADLFQIAGFGTKNLKADKVASKVFQCKNGNSFKAGSGANIDARGNLEILSVGYNIAQQNKLNVFDKMIWDAHSHNDYEHNRPLYDAIEYNFRSFEADVFLVGDSLYVAHNFNDIKPGRTLQQLYLEPLKNEIIKNSGSVYGNGQEVILFIDIKDDALRTYRQLNRILSDYQPYLTSFNNNQKKQGCIKVVVSGNRPIEYMKNENTRLASYDGRLEDLDSGINPDLMPVISDSWLKHFAWNGNGQMPEHEKLKLQEIATSAKRKGYVLRFWGTPNRTAQQRQNMWTVLSDSGVSLIGVDELEEFSNFIIQKHNENKPAQ